MNFKHISRIAGLSLVVAISSCTRHAGEPVSRAVLYNNETDVDTDGYVFFKLLHEKAKFETQLATYVQSAPASSAAKELAAKVIETYEGMIPELESLAEAHFVVLPDPGMPGFSVPHHFSTDSLGSFSSEAYIAHVQHEQGTILEQLRRAERNTAKTLRTYAHEKLPAVEEVFALSGGKADHGAHH
ncbi:hypothetical protein JHJ32_05680 [Parapedobacter sp. ISTM3]|uniref:hypothetical protein n=1 Tax=Parapedobacter sp. ISTM3 TaxID=2800130 RepID=UPI001903F48B|nr:hypothetical protein [Parapedobacter sp. ISTM3]MBK1439467.1 hypothetical protein [Parapedobacter sp. ISTM3]